MTPDFSLSAEQSAAVSHPWTGSLCLIGPAGCGKTSAAAARLDAMLHSGLPAETVLILVPQRTLAARYYEVLQQPDLPPGGVANVVTLGGLGQRMVQLFWPVISESAGFRGSSNLPSFLTLETAQYYLARLVTPWIEQRGFFDGVRVDRNRLFSQILDNLNKAAAIGFNYSEIGERLKSAWVGEIAQQRIYDQAQECAQLFRDYCLQNNLLDFSLQMEVFLRHVWPLPEFQAFFYRTYRHLIFDNVEEDVPVVHDLVLEWMPHFASSLLISDQDGGYRLFLGADPTSASRLMEICDHRIEFTQSWVNTGEMDETIRAFQQAIARRLPTPLPPGIRIAMQVAQYRYVPEMAAGAAQTAAALVREAGIPPGQIAVLSPFMSDSLRFTLTDQFSRTQLRVHSHRPSRSLREEPATLCLMTLARLAHPVWNLPQPSPYQLRFALTQAIEDMDLVRADLLVRGIKASRRVPDSLASFDSLQPVLQNRITFMLGNHYEHLRDWLMEYQSGEVQDLDIFLSRLFGEVLSQPGFRFHQDLDAAAVAARLIESVQKFRWGTQENATDPLELGREYFRMVEAGVIAAQYLQAWEEPPQDAVLLAPAYTFLMTNRPVDIQIWLDAGSIGWWERLNQPLTHPHVLSRNWNRAAVWTDAYEYTYNQESLDRLLTGLLRRCRQQVYIFTSGTNEQGENPRGPLLQAIQGILRRLPTAEGGHV